MLEISQSHEAIDLSAIWTAQHPTDTKSGPPPGWSSYLAPSGNQKRSPTWGGRVIWHPEDTKSGPPPGCSVRFGHETGREWTKINITSQNDSKNIDASPAVTTGMPQDPYFWSFQGRNGQVGGMGRQPFKLVDFRGQFPVDFSVPLRMASAEDAHEQKLTFCGCLPPTRGHHTKFCEQPGGLPPLRTLLQAGGASPTGGALGAFGPLKKSLRSGAKVPLGPLGPLKSRFAPGSMPGIPQNGQLRFLFHAQNLIFFAFPGMK